MRAWLITLVGVMVMGVVLGRDQRADPALYNLGVGIYDVTGPAAGVNLMGYANPSQINKGIHLRLFSRAFIFDDTVTRSVFVSVDCGMMAQNVKFAVVDRLQVLYGPTLYTAKNVMLSGIHTHSGPAGYMQYLLFDITSEGFVWETYYAMVEGIVNSIVMAHDNVVPGRLYLSAGELLEASINRSPTAYLNNPKAERDLYPYDTDKTMTLLRLVAEDGTDLGMVNWYSVHPTSMNNTNKLVSGDNKGYAGQLFEAAMNPGQMPGKGKFVAAFAQTNCGDVSPNTDGPKCQDTGLPCDIETSTCGGRSHNCYAAGPGKDMFESTKIIGTKQFLKAWELFNASDSVLVSGPVQFAHQYLDMDGYQVYLNDNTTGRTCRPALGYSFAAGTTDGPGAFDFTQGMTVDKPFWNMVAGVLHTPNEQQKACHAPKPILLDTGYINTPYPWHPQIVETQVGRVGQLVILPVPGEFSTMCGRRFRDHLAAAMALEGVPDIVPVIGGLSNVYTHYVTTLQEYQIQRYEGASTIYGPHTCNAYMQQYSYLAAAMVRGETLEAGPTPPNLMDQVISFLPPVFFDGAPFEFNFGDVVAQPYPLAYAGETVTAKFVAGHPRNDVQLGGSFLTVERLMDLNDTWVVVATDASWETRYIWDRTTTLLGHSVATVHWDIPLEVIVGTYRLTHTGHYKTFLRGITLYRGSSNSFRVVQAPVTGMDIISSKVDEVEPWWKTVFMR